DRDGQPRGAVRVGRDRAGAVFDHHLVLVAAAVGTAAHHPVDHRAGGAGLVRPELLREPAEDLGEDRGAVFPGHHLGQLGVRGRLHELGELRRLHRLDLGQVNLGHVATSRLVALHHRAYYATAPPANLPRPVVGARHPGGRRVPPPVTTAYPAGPDPARQRYASMLR